MSKTSKNKANKMKIVKSQEQCPTIKQTRKRLIRKVLGYRNQNEVGKCDKSYVYEVNFNVRVIKHNLNDIFSLMHLLCFVHKFMIKYCKTCIKIINMKPCWKLIFNKFCSKLVAFACDKIRLATFLLLRFNVF